MSCFKTQIFIAILLRILFPRYTNDNVSLAHHDVDSFRVFKMTVKDNKLRAKAGLKALNFVSKMIS